MNENNGHMPPPNGAIPVQIRTDLFQAVNECASASGSTPTEVLNTWLLMGKRVFDNIMQAIPLQEKLIDQMQRIAAVEPPPLSDEPEEVDPRSAEDILKERQRFAGVAKKTDGEPS